MSEKFSFFNAELVDNNYDRTYLAEDYARYFASFIGNGVYPNPTTNLQVSANGTDMVITVASGKAWINGYFYENTNNLLFSLANADGVLKRIDSIAIQLDLINRQIKTVVKKGVFAITPVATELTRTADVYEIQIATVYIGAGVIKVNQANVTDTRQNNSVCGLVSGVVDQIDTTGLFTQYNDTFNIWFNDIKSKLGADIAGNLQLEIDAINNSKGAANGLALLDANSKLAQMPTVSDIGAVPTSRTINGHTLTGNITVTKADLGINLVDNTADANKSVNYANSSNYSNTAGSAPANGGTANSAHYSSHAVGSGGSALRNVTMSTVTPSGGVDGDVWHQYK